MDINHEEFVTILKEKDENEDERQFKKWKWKIVWNYEIE